MERGDILANDMYISGVTKKYPEYLLEKRMEIEGNVLACLCKDLLLLDEVNLNKENFLSKDGRFYFNLLKAIRNKGFNVLDDVTIESNMPDLILEAYHQRGGYEFIEDMMQSVSQSNYETYLDLLYRENLFITLYDEGFNLEKPILYKNKKIKPIELFRKMTSEQVTDWYELKISSFETANSSKILEEEIVTFEDSFIDDCKEGAEMGVPFDIAGKDVKNEPINCFPFLSAQTMGLLDGTLTMMGGFSSAGKSTWWITVIMALLHYDRKILIITNEENINKFKHKIIIWILAKYFKYYMVTKSKLVSGNLTKENQEYIKKAMEYWKDNFHGKLKIIHIEDADMSLIKKEVRKNVLRYGYDTVLYDTFKIQENDFDTVRQDLALVRDSRELDKLAKKYNIIVMASVQLAERYKGKLFLDSSVLSNSKQIKEILEGLFLMRTTYKEELDPENKKMYCFPFRTVKDSVTDKWIEEPYEPNPNKVYRTLFVEKTRNGENSSDNGIAYLLEFDGAHSIFREVAKCRPKHGVIQ